MEITFKNVTKSFSDTRRCVSHKVIINLSFSIKKTGIYCINGRSGIGKTTILNLISGLLKPDSGQIIVKPSGIISYSFQENLLLPWMTVKNNLLLVLISNRTISDNEKIEQITQLLKYFQMESKLNSFPSELSGGQKQRVNIIRSLLIQSKIMLLDEPFSSLDKENCQLVGKYLADYSKNNKAIVVIITHKLSSEIKYIDQIFTLTTDSNEQVLKKFVYQKP